MTRKKGDGWEHELANPRAELYGDWVGDGIKSGVHRFDGVCQEKCGLNPSLGRDDTCPSSRSVQWLWAFLPKSHTAARARIKDATKNSSPPILSVLLTFFPFLPLKRKTEAWKKYRLSEDQFWEHFETFLGWEMQLRGRSISRFWKSCPPTDYYRITQMV